MMARALASAGEVAALVIFLLGLLSAGYAVLRALWGRVRPFPPEAIRLDLARSISLALEFLLVASLLRTVARQPSWDELGRLAALIGIRLLVNLFLGRALHEASESPGHERPRPAA